MYYNDIREIFLDYNMNVFINLHEDIKEIYEDLGFFNKSVSQDFIKMIMECIQLNESVYHNNDNSSDDDSEVVKKY
jgi:hypothetical protein